MPKWTGKDLPRLEGRTVVITGAGSGIGLIAARELARAGATVIAAVRNPAKARSALAAIDGSVRVRQLDVSDLGSIRAFADATEGSVDLLVNNAGVMDIPAQRTADGFDLQTATNYLGPFVLTNLLADRITDRVVSVTSQLHRMAELDLADLDWRARPYHPTPSTGRCRFCTPPPRTCPATRTSGRMVRAASRGTPSSAGPAAAASTRTRPGGYGKPRRRSPASVRYPRPPDITEGPDLAIGRYQLA